MFAGWRTVSPAHSCQLCLDERAAHNSITAS
eukprot:contig_33272_g8040